MFEVPARDYPRPELQEETNPLFYYRAAQICVWTPILTALFCKGMENALDGQSGQWVAFGYKAVGSLSALALLLGIGAGIVAACGMSRHHGTGRILWRTISGIVLNVLLLGMLATGFIRGLQTKTQDRKAMASLVQVSQEVQAQARKELASGQKLTYESAVQPKIERMKSALDEVAAGGSDATALAARASKAYVEQMQMLIKDHMATAKLLLSPPLLDMSAVKQPAQLAEKKKLVQNFLAANEKYMAFIRKGATAYREELDRFRVPGTMADAAVAGFERVTKQRNFTMVRIREADQRTGLAMLGMLDVLDKSWGGWKYSAEKKKVIITDGATTEKYNACFKEMKSAAAEGVQLQNQLKNMRDVAVNGI